MNYSVEIRGKTCSLPPFTAEMDDLLGSITNIEARVACGDISRRQAREEQYAFVTRCTGESLPPLEEVDVNELSIACLEIVNAYMKPTVDAKLATLQDTVRKIVDNPDVNRLYAMSRRKKH